MELLAIAIVKDIMLYIMVLAAIIVIPAKLGGYGHIFQHGGGRAQTTLLQVR